MTTPETERRPVADRIARRVDQAGLSIDAHLLHALAAYVDLLMRWNHHINLTALSHDDHGIDRLIVEPLVAARRLPTPEAAVTDIGSGGGSPAIPMKLAAPRVRLRMVESRAKKAAFLREVVRQLGLAGTVVEACRVEELADRQTRHAAGNAGRRHPGGRSEELADRQNRFGESDVVTVRAVRVGARMLRELQPLVRPGGMVFLFRSTRESLDARSLTPWRVDAAWPLLDPDHRLIVLKRGRG